MGEEIRRIGVLTSGGDAPGMNAAIRGVTLAARHRGIEVMGIYSGYAGLLAREMKLFDLSDVEDIAPKGGTVLYSARCDAFLQEQGQQDAICACRENRIDALAVIGGDGSFRGAADLCAKGLPCVGIPGSIDNDIPASETSVGFDTAVNTAVSLMDRLRDTSESHARCNLIEVMGRSCGQLALWAGIGAGAAGVMLGELPFDREAVIQTIRHSRAGGQREFLISIAEGIHKQDPHAVEELAKAITESTGIETRLTILGHVVRVGAPSAYDRMLGAQMGEFAVDLLTQGKGNAGIVLQDGGLRALPFSTLAHWDRLYRDLLPFGDNTPLPKDLPLPLAKRIRTLRERYRLSRILSGE